MTVDDAAAFQQLQWAVQALAAEPEEQLSLFPSFVEKPAELIDDYDNWYGGTKWRPAPWMSAEQREALARLHHVATAIPVSDYSEFAVREGCSWQHLRAVARSTLEALGWPRLLPPSERSAYVLGQK
jgi:hypothetical protein